LSANFDSSLEVTFLIPVTPELRSEPYYFGTIDSIGMGVNGIPLTANPPSVTVAEAGVGGTGSGNIPALDLCGGHPDPSGYYHWHFIPQSINTVYAADDYNYTELYDISCNNIYIDYDNPSAFAGLAKDGFPLYGALDSVDGLDTEPATVAELDECNGHSHATNEYP
ncbi:YHYH protein, partial [Wenyingzhuangia sp. 1_MG-2023]|nr:YHYH protein [Wenyingzhuangia sp. 1_MG-2023]